MHNDFDSPTRPRPANEGGEAYFFMVPVASPSFAIVGLLPCPV
jgi:hypothetical protein